MGKFEERKLKWQPTCYKCAHYLNDPDDDYAGYCLLDISPEDRKYIIENIDQYEEDIPDRVYELLKFYMVKCWDWYDSKRRVDTDDCCQFFEWDSYYKRGEEKQDGEV